MEYEQIHSDVDVVVVGLGIAGLSAGLSAAEAGAETVIIEKSPKSKRGGHTRYTGGGWRFPMGDIDGVRSLVDEDDGYKFDGDIDPYTKQKFFDDLMMFSEGRADPALCELLVENAFEDMQWVNDHGVRFTAQDVVSDGNMEDQLRESIENGIVHTVGEGEGIVESLASTAEDLGVELHHDTEMRSLETGEENEITGIVAKRSNEKVKYESNTVVLCAGTFVASPERRVRYFGRNSDVCIIRGSRYNTGEVLDEALSSGAQSHGPWGSAHQVMNDARAPAVEGGRTRIDGYQYGVILNENGERFVDEGEDIRRKTYVKVGNALFDQPGNRGYVIFDSSVSDFVSSQTGLPPNQANSLEELVDGLDIRNPETALDTIEQFNDATSDGTLDPTTLDNLGTDGVSPAKSNWAAPLTEPPFYSFTVVPGLTFAYGGLKVNADSEVIDTQENPMTGLWAAGNITAGLFYKNYAGGTALTYGVTFGRIAGRNAAKFAREEKS